MPQGAAGGTALLGAPGAQTTAPPLAVPLARPTTTGPPPQAAPAIDLAVPRGAPPVVPRRPMPVPGGPPPTHGVQDAQRPTAEVLAANAAQEAAAAGPRDISELFAQALDAYWREAAEGEGAAQAAPGSEVDVGELIAQALAAVAPRTEEAKEETWEGADSGGQGTERGVPETQAQAMGSGVVEPSGECAKVDGVEDWMWEWREWRQVAPGEPCPAGLVYSMDLHAGTSCARLPDNLRARPDAVGAARGGGADERPPAPFPPRPNTPPAVIAAGDKAEGEQEEVDVRAHLAAALTRIIAAGPPPTTEALEEEDQRRMSDGAQDTMEQDEEPEFVGAKAAHEVGPHELGVADKAGPKTGEVETCRHWAKGLHAGRCQPICPPPTAGAAGSTPRFAPDPPGHGSCRGPSA